MTAPTCPDCGAELVILHRLERNETAVTHRVGTTCTRGVA